MSNDRNFFGQSRQASGVPSDIMPRSQFQNFGGAASEPGRAFAGGPPSPGYSLDGRTPIQPPSGTDPVPLPNIQPPVYTAPVPLPGNVGRHGEIPYNSPPSRFGGSLTPNRRVGGHANWSGEDRRARGLPAGLPGPLRRGLISDGIWNSGVGRTGPFRAY